MAKVAAKKAPAKVVSLDSVRKATAKAPAKKTAPEVTGAKATIIAMMQRKNGVSAAEVCAKLGWVRAAGTISRAIKLAPFKVNKVKGDDGVTRYIAAR
jgi:hypothetical protein